MAGFFLECSWLCRMTHDQQFIFLGTIRTPTKGNAYASCILLHGPKLSTFNSSFRIQIVKRPVSSILKILQGAQSSIVAVISESAAWMASISAEKLSSNIKIVRSPCRFKNLSSGPFEKLGSFFSRSNFSANLVPLLEKDSKLRLRDFLDVVKLILLIASPIPLI